MIKPKSVIEDLRAYDNIRVIGLTRVNEKQAYNITLLDEEGKDILSNICYTIEYIDSDIVHDNRLKIKLYSTYGIQGGNTEIQKEILNNKYGKKEQTMKKDIKEFQDIEDGSVVTVEVLQGLSAWENVIVIFLGISDKTLVFKAVLFESVMANQKKLYVIYDNKQISPSWILKSLKRSDEF